MSVLAEFLKQEEKRLAEERPARATAVGEWQAAVSQLFQQFESWIRTADPHGIMVHRFGEKTAYENRLGKYSVKTLTVELDGRAITFDPRARHT
ncbi:MAG: hypothetical protein ABGY75_05555, partial [Gemmataceae bacterium]